MIIVSMCEKNGITQVTYVLILLRGARQIGKSSAVRHVRILPLYALSQL